MLTKKWILLGICCLLVLHLPVVAQTPQYGPWTTSNCYRGLDYCVRKDYYDKNLNKYKWSVKFRNRYRIKVHFNFILKESSAATANPISRMSLQSGSEDGSWFFVPEGNRVRVFIDGVRFGDSDEGDRAVCDDGTPTYPAKKQPPATSPTTPASKTTTGNSTTSSGKPTGSNSNTASRPANNTNKPATTTQGGATGSTQSAEAERQRQQREAEQRRQQQQEAFRQQEQRYQQQLQEITRKSEMRAQRDGAILDGIGGIYSIIMENKAKKGLAEDAEKRSSRIDEFKKKMAQGGYELVDCNSCNGEGYWNCAQCKSQGKIVCNSCSGRAGSTCNKCRGTGKTNYGPYSLACTGCMGSGVTKCLVCGNAGASICFICHGRTQRQCYHCAGTGKRLNAISTSATPVVTDDDNESGQNEKKPDPYRQLKLDLALDSTVIAGFNRMQKPNAVKKGVDSVYYIGFKRPYREDGDKGTLTLQLFAIYRYSDGSYPLMSDILEKSKYETQSTRNGSTRLLGYFETLAAAKKALENIAQNARNNGVTVVQDTKPKKINPPSSAQPKADDFWNN